MLRAVLGARLRAGSVAVALVVGGLLPAAPDAPACAAGSDAAALVIDKGAEVLRYCVEFPGGEDEVSGIELIELAGVQHGLSYRFEPFGRNGLAVCMLDGLERSDGECLGLPYWVYWHGGGSGGWDYSSVGAQEWTVRDGAVEGWAWGGSTTAPPPTTFKSVCAAPEPAPSPSPSEGGPSPPKESGGPPRHSSKPEGSHRDGSGGAPRARSAGSGGATEPAGAAGETDGKGAPQAPGGDGSGGRSNDPASGSGAGPSGGDATPTPAGGEKSSRSDEKEAMAGAPTRDRGGSGGGARSSELPPGRPAPRAQPVTGSGPPIAGLAGLGAALLLIGAAGALLRRRSRPVARAEDNPAPGAARPRRGTGAG